MSTEVKREPYQGIKIHHGKEFELCYLRHQYLRKAANNPTEAEMSPYKNIILGQVRKTLVDYGSIFTLMGFQRDDLISIGNVHLVSFLGLFAIEQDINKFNTFKRIFQQNNNKEPNQEDILNKNKANFTSFLKQRFEELVRICNQKGRNVKGLYTESYLVFAGPNKPPLVLENLVHNYEKLGFRKISMPVFKAVKKQVEDKHNSIFQFNGLWYVCVSVERKELNLSDFCGQDQDPYDTIHHMTPDQIFEINFYKNKVEDFNKSSRASKIVQLKKFVIENKDKISNEDEVTTARKILRELGAPLD